LNYSNALALEKTSMNRRKFLKIAGSSAVIVAAGGGGFVATRTPTEALEPWKNAGSLYADPMRRALSYAILAPNPHNRQPWIVDLKSDTEVVLTCDLDRLLPVTDPFSRQIVIGLGCFLELFSIAAADQGYLADIQYFPDGEPDDELDRRPIAHLSLNKQNRLEGDPLFAHTLNRHTNRNPYDTSRAVGDNVLLRLRDAATDSVRVGAANDNKLLNDLRTLTRDAMFTEFRTPNAYRESIDLMRIGRAEIEANPDGIALRGAFLETLSLAGILNRENLADPTSSAFQTGLAMFDEGAMTSMGFVWINTLGNDRTAQIEAGRAYMRIALQATADDLAMQPMSQALQEYAAMAPYHEAIHELLTDQPGERVQMLARIGYAENTDPAPRWPLATRLKES
jgi:hypothetical protein